MNVAVDDLRGLTLLDGLSDTDLQKLASWSQRRVVAEGQRLTPEGASGYLFFIILEGTADVTQDDRHIRSLGRGDHFGELAILEGGRRTASVVATSPMVLAEVFGADFRQIDTEIPALAERIRATAASRD